MQKDAANISKTLELLREQRVESQSEIAKKAGISQSTVSRRLRKPPQRHSDATTKLCSYATAKVEGSPGPAMKKGVQKAFDEVWNKSPAHAEAISKIIDAFAELCRTDSKEERSA